MNLEELKQQLFCLWSHVFLIQLRTLISMKWSPCLRIHSLFGDREGSMLTEIKTGIKTGKQKAPNNIKMGEHGRGWLNLVTVSIAFHTAWSGNMGCCGRCTTWSRETPSQHQPGQEGAIYRCEDVRLAVKIPMCLSRDTLQEPCRHLAGTLQSLTPDTSPSQGVVRRDRCYQVFRCRQGPGTSPDHHWQLDLQLRKGVKTF